MESPETDVSRSPLWLALRVIDEPVAVFRELAERPRALVPVIFLAIAGAAVAFGTPAERLQDAAREQADAMESVMGDRFTDADRVRVIDQAASPRTRTFSFAAVVVGGLIGMCLTAFVLKMIFGATSGTEITFRDEFAIAAHAYVPQVLGMVLGVGLMALAGLDRPDFSLGFLFSETGSFLQVFASQITLFGAWGVLLLALGNQIKTKAPSITGALTIVGGIWVLLKLAGAGIGTMFLP